MIAGTPTVGPADMPLRIMVAVVTRGRGQAVAGLLRSWRDMVRPEGCHVDGLVVDNNDAETVLGLVERSDGQGLRLFYVWERGAGIPIARNRAARFALDGGYDLLAFVDDDEVVACRWLTALVRSYRQRKQALVGGPVRMASSHPASGMLERSLAAHYRSRERRAARQAARGLRVTVVTNNWLAETSLFGEHAIWFDTGLRFDGGSDARFFDDVVARGLPTGWVPSAVVTETVAPERLSFGYQYRRGRDQTIAWIRRKLAANRARVLVIAMIWIWTAVAVVPLAVSVPLTRGISLVPFARALGRLSGTVVGLAGGRSDLYRR